MFEGVQERAHVSGDERLHQMEHVPVAVLTGRATVSAGEAVAIAFRGRADTRSFGARTFGLTTSMGGQR